MRRTTLFGTLFMASLVMSPALALSAPPGPPPGQGPRGPGNAPPEEGDRGPGGPRFREIRGRMLRQEAGLDEATAVRTEKVLDQFEPRRRELMKEQHHRMRTLHELLDTDSNDQKAYQEALNGMMSATKEMQELKQREIAALQQVLTPKQQARVMVTLREMRKRAKRMMLEHRGEGRWGGEHPGMGPGPGPGRDGDDEGGDRSDGLF